MKHCPADAPCPCGQVHGQGSTKAQPIRYFDCCGRYLDGHTSAPEPFAPDAHTLMRSRYSAFVLERDAYLLATWHPAHRPAVVEFDPDVKWLGLEVRSYTPPTLASPDEAFVEFVARQKPKGAGAVRLHEHSRFQRAQGRWYYLDGIQT
jgi:SEC-C motif-containing protein